MTEGFFVTSR